MTAEWLTLGRAAEYLGVSENILRRWADQHRIRAFRTPGGHRRFRRSDLEAFVRGSDVTRLVTPLVLIVDEDVRVRGLVRQILEEEGYSVREAATADQSFELLEQELPDLILLGVLMPAVEGWKVVRRVHDRQGRDTIPAIIFIGEPPDVTQLVESTKRLLPV